MTSSDVNMHTASANIIACLDEIFKKGYNIGYGGCDYTYTIGELRAIEKLLAWISQIIYAEVFMQKEIEINGDYAEPEMYSEMIESAVDGLFEYRNIHPDGIPFFIIEGNNLILKRSPYFIFEERLMYKTGFIDTEAGGEEEEVNA
ncbi:MAG: hypothetical protein WCK67_08585 [bacterium]